MNQPEIKNKLKLQTELAQWVNDCGITHNATNRRLSKILTTCELMKIVFFLVLIIVFF